MFEGSAVNLLIIDIEEKAGELVGDLKSGVVPRTPEDSEVNLLLEASPIDGEGKALQVVVAAPLFHDPLNCFIVCEIRTHFPRYR